MWHFLLFVINPSEVEKMKRNLVTTPISFFWRIQWATKWIMVRVSVHAWVDCQFCQEKPNSAPHQKEGFFTIIQTLFQQKITLLYLVGFLHLFPEHHFKGPSKIPWRSKDSIFYLLRLWNSLEYWHTLHFSFVSG